MGVAPGADVRLSNEKIETYRNFCNKIWNASRFVLMNLTDFAPAGVPAADNLSIADKWILTEYQNTVRTITDNLEHYEMCIRDSYYTRPP